MRRLVLTLFLAIIVPLIVSFDLQCKAENGKWTTDLGNLYYCWNSSAVITTPNKRITSVNGATTPTTFQGISFSGTVHYLPKDIAKFFPNLRGLAIGTARLKTIQAADLQGLNNLECLWINTNDIEELSSDLFQYTPKVNDLYLPNNKISHIGKDLLKNFHSFKRIDLTNNKCINKVVTSGFEAFKTELQTKCPFHGEITEAKNSKPETEKHNDTIRKLQTDYNEKIKKLETEITNAKLTTQKLEAEIERLKQVIKVNKLETEHQKNKTSKLEAEITNAKLPTQNLEADNDRLKRTCYNGLLDMATKLLYIQSAELKKSNRTVNLVEKVDAEADVVLKVISEIENVTMLEMNIKSLKTMVTSIVDSAENDVQPNLTNVVIDHQNAMFLPVNLGHFLPSLQRLSVTFSGLYGLDTRSFIGMQKLIALNFTGNKIVEIPEEAFAELPSLVELDLSHNNIEVIADEAFEENVELDTLRLNHNKLTAISGPIFKHQQKLRVLFLNDNKLKFINAALLSASKVLEIVDMSSNECIDLSFPNTTLNGISSEIMDKCIAPVQPQVQPQGS